MTRNYLDILAETIRTNWNQPALTDFYLTEDGTAQDTSRGNHYTYGEMYAELCRVADRLTSLGLQKGDHIAICGANSAHWCIAYLAVAKMQGVSVTVMHSLQPDEIARLVAFSDAKALFTNEDIWEELRSQSIPQAESVIGLENWQVLRGEKAQTPNRESKISNRDISFPSSAPDDLAMICFTSGTSGNAKGVMLPYRSITANINYFYGDYRKAVQNRKNIVTLPLAHMFACMNECLKPLCVGMNVNIINLSFYHASFASICELIEPAYIDLVPQMLNMAVSESTIPILRKENLYTVFIGGSGLNQETEEKIVNLNIPIATGYGMSECGPLISATFSDKYRMGSVGKILPTLTARISPAGEILIKGENVMLGYYKDPEATAQKIDSDGWLHTGDAGYMDEDGYLYVTGRIGQDMIVLPNGENIHPEDIENKINALPEVKESIVVARDGKLVAMVVLEQGAKSKEQGSETAALKEQRRVILRAINPQLPLYSQLYDIEFLDKPLEHTAKQTIKRYLYK